MDKYPLKKYPIVGACGLNCGLCPRYHAKGTSRCPGCCGQDFWQKHPSCGFVTCCVKQRELETCAQCTDFTDCGRVASNLEAADYHDSFLSYRPLADNLAFIREKGIEQFSQFELEKLEFLRHLIDNYDDGRSKSFYCISCQLLPLDRLKKALAGVMVEADGAVGIREKAATVRAVITALAEELQLDLRLRK